MAKKKLKCNTGNYQCGNVCQSEGRNCYSDVESTKSLDDFAKLVKLRVNQDLGGKHKPTKKTLKTWMADKEGQDLLDQLDRHILYWQKATGAEQSFTPGTVGMIPANVKGQAKLDMLDDIMSVQAKPMTSADAKNMSKSEKRLAQLADEGPKMLKPKLFKYNISDSDYETLTNLQAGFYTSWSTSAKSKKIKQENPDIARIEAMAISSYIGSGYIQMSKALYAPDKVSKNYIAGVTELDIIAANGLAKLPSPTKQSISDASKKHAGALSSEVLADADAVPDSFNRWISIPPSQSADFAAKYEVGQEIREATFFATTWKKQLSFASDGANFQYKVTPRLDGTGKGKYVDHFKMGNVEGELLYPPQSRFIVTGNTYDANKNTWLIELAEV